MSPWTVLGWILVAFAGAFLVLFVAAAVVAGVKVTREAYRHQRDSRLSLNGVPATCALCNRAAEYRTESGPRCEPHLTQRAPAGRKTYSERIMSHV